MNEPTTIPRSPETEPRVYDNFIYNKGSNGESMGKPFKTKSCREFGSMGILTPGGG